MGVLLDLDEYRRRRFEPEPVAAPTIVMFILCALFMIPWWVGVWTIGAWALGFFVK
jgi:hypothetical protein